MPRRRSGSAGTRLAGYQQLVRGEPFRGKFRDSFERPVPFVPGKPAAIAFELPDVAHTFRSGHRLMVHVQSSWFPLIDRNPAGVHGHPGGEGRRLPDGHPPRLAIGGPPVVDPRAGLAGGGEAHHRAVTRREGPLDDRVQAAPSQRRDAHRSDRRYPRTRQSASHAPCAFVDRPRFHRACSAMDMLGDTGQALRSYIHQCEGPVDIGSSYLLVSGALQVLYVQQDAAFWLCEALGAPRAVAQFSRPETWIRAAGNEYLAEVRDLRNSSVGHPVNRSQAPPAEQGSYLRRRCDSACNERLSRRTETPR